MEESGPEKGVIRYERGLFSEESLDSLKSLNPLENGRIFPPSVASVESLRSLEPLEDGPFSKDPCSKRPLFPNPKEEESGMSRDFAGCPGPLAVFKKFAQEEFVHIFRSLIAAISIRSLGIQGRDSCVRKVVRVFSLPKIPARKGFSFDPPRPATETLSYKEFEHMEPFPEWVAPLSDGWPHT